MATPDEPQQNGHLSTDEQNEHSQSNLRSASGWDGKLRVAPRSAVLANPEALTDPEYSDPEAPPPEEIAADEDLLDDESPEVEDIDLVHCRISSIPALRLERFKQLKRLCLRQNAVSSLDFPDSLSETLEELDMYDNLISHLKGLDTFQKLITLDLSFNKIKHIKHVSHLTTLKELYFVQNKILRIENLDNLVNLTMIELAANRLREIENLDRLTNLRELWLGKNKITEIKNLSNLQSLRLLDLKSNRLTSLSGLEHLPLLEELYVSHNAITSLSEPDDPSKSVLAANKALRVLDISNNRISSLVHISQLSQLEEFWASNNQFADFREVERELGGLEKLETVYLEGNPLETQGPAVYRNKVKLALPRVKQVDATFVRV